MAYGRFYFCAICWMLTIYHAACIPSFKDYRNHPCIRPCQDGAAPMECVYDFSIEYYHTLTKACFNCPFNLTDCSRPHCVPADGVMRGLLAVNRMLPGPGIHVCQNDIIVVNVHNHMQDFQGTSIHWHGVYQHGVQHMDGVAMLTQCPIPAETSFQYKFPAANAGTHFWHAHAGLQRSDGIFGHLVIRQPPSLDPNFHLYDYDLPEHSIMVHDWLVELSGGRFADHHLGAGDNKPQLMLIEGKGMHRKFVDTENRTHYTPRAIFKVTPGNRYRFRVVGNGILNCPIQFSIDSHMLMMIASDGSPFEPIVVDSFNIFAGERYDFVLDANKTVENYYIRVRGLADCGVKKAHQTAILKYEGAGESLPSGPTDWDSAARGGILLNPLNTKGTDTKIPVVRLKSRLPDDKTSQAIPDKKFYLAMDFHQIDNYHFNYPNLYSLSEFKTNRLLSPQINHISNILPSSPPLTQFQDIPKDVFCNKDTVNKNCTEEFCECVHHYKVALGDVVELVLIDEGLPWDANHPMHLHGHGFRVVAMERVNKSTTLAQIKAMDEAGEIPRKLNKSILKDTVTVPDGGYTVVRFLADNPGMWFLHCHIEFHVEIGMGLFIQVGEPSQFTKPPRNFPKCGNWHYTGEQDSPPQPCTNAVSPSALKTSLPVLVMLLSYLLTHISYY